MNGQIFTVKWPIFMIGVDIAPIFQCRGTEQFIAFLNGSDFEIKKRKISWGEMREKVSIQTIKNVLNCPNMPREYHVKYTHGAPKNFSLERVRGKKMYQTRKSKRIKKKTRKSKGTKKALFSFSFANTLLYSSVRLPLF